MKSKEYAYEILRKLGCETKEELNKKLECSDPNFKMILGHEMYELIKDRICWVFRTAEDRKIKNINRISAVLREADEFRDSVLRHLGLDYMVDHTDLSVTNLFASSLKQESVDTYMQLVVTLDQNRLKKGLIQC